MKLKQFLNDAILKPLEHMENTIENQIPTNHDQVAAPIVHSTPEGEKAMEEPVQRGVDRSAYNCPECQGEGLLVSGAVCQKCKGTGKI